MGGSQGLDDILIYNITSDSTSTISCPITSGSKNGGRCAIFKEKYPNIEHKYCGKDSVLMPGLINAHVHVEFSANKTDLSYGDFINWLYSVIENREK